MPEKPLPPKPVYDWKSDRLGGALGIMILAPILEALVVAAHGGKSQALPIALVFFLGFSRWGSWILSWATGWDVSRWMDGGWVSGWAVSLAGLVASSLIGHKLSLMPSRWIFDYLIDVGGNPWKAGFLLAMPSLFILEFLMIAGTFLIAAPLRLIRTVWQKRNAPPT
ncbi:hypothetical protein [Acidithiobacillus sulfuriphilus]|uniref:hypothetical protein n=1 Tax=Acidithiobacillus sulfuriphilus TaxID=1867749 RepID=UPI003F5EF12F